MGCMIKQLLHVCIWPLRASEGCKSSLLCMCSWLGVPNTTHSLCVCHVAADKNTRSCVWQVLCLLCARLSASASSLFCKSVVSSQNTCPWCCSLRLRHNVSYIYIYIIFIYIYVFTYARMLHACEDGPCGDHPTFTIAEGKQGFGSSRNSRPMHRFHGSVHPECTQFAAENGASKDNCLSLSAEKPGCHQSVQRS